MKWPFLNGKTKMVGNQEVFGGYNHNLRISEGEFYEMQNMSSDYYPILAPRKKRGVFQSGEAIHGLIAKDGLGWVDGKDFVINGHPVDLGLEAGEKQLLSMGAYVIILPDKKYINTLDFQDHGSMEAFFTTVAPVVFTLCDMDGNVYTPAYTQPGQPEEPENMELWLDTSSVPSVLKQWSATTAMWVSVEGTYVRIESSGIGKAFDIYDGVFLKGLSGELTDYASGEPLLDPSELQALEGTAVIWAKGDDFIVISGMLTMTRTIPEAVTVSREMPAMDFVVERENRLWGCRYGLNKDGQIVNEIYASKLGDFKNWNCFMGISTDSYAVSVGSDGPFTGASCYAGYPLFWKENCVHKIFGDYPANFAIQTTACRGVQQGSERSLAIVNELLYYKARHAVCVYDGSLPVEISTVLGDQTFYDAVAGGHGNKYYISMKDIFGKPHLFVYDTVRNLWHREDDLQVASFCSCKDELYCIEKNGGKILTLLNSGKEPEKAVRWMVQTGVQGLYLAEQKYVSRLLLRLSMEQGSRIWISVQYDSMGGWENIGSISGRSMKSFVFPIRPRRCDHFRLKIEGEGDVRIHSITKTIVQGSDRV